jgi:hypothetical protein
MYLFETLKKKFMDSKIFASIFIASVIQSAAIIWWASSLTMRVDHHNDWISNHRTTAQLIHRLDERVDFIKRSVERIENYLVGAHRRHG